MLETLLDYEPKGIEQKLYNELGTVYGTGSFEMYNLEPRKKLLMNTDLSGFPLTWSPIDNMPSIRNSILYPNNTMGAIFDGPTSIDHIQFDLNGNLLHTNNKNIKRKDIYSP